MVGYVAAFGIGIWAAGNSDPSFSATIVLACLFLFAFICGFDWWRKRAHTCLISAILLFLWLVSGMVRMGSVEQSAAGSVREYEGKTVTVRGTIAGTPTVSIGIHGEWRIHYEVILDTVIADEKNKIPHPMTGGVRLSVRQKQPLPEGRDGDSITVSGNVRLFHSYHNPGQPDWGAALGARGIDARISAVPGSVQILRREGEESPVTRLERWRTQVRAAMMEAMPDKDAALIMGMLFGGYDGIERQTVRDFAATGIVHILSVSGAHIALVAGAIFWLTRRLLIPEKWGAAIAAVAMVGYGIISGFSAPVIRSVVMGLIGMVAIGMGRLSSAPRALSLATLGMLIYEPRNLFDISFQLSIGCTAGLLFLHPKLLAWLRGVAPEWAAEGTAATLAAQLAVIPFLSWYFSTFPIISLIANLLVVPILEAVILLGLFGTLLAGEFLTLAHIMFVGVSLLTGFAVEMNRFLARLPGGTVYLPAMGIGAGFLYYVLLLWVAGFAEKWGLSPVNLWRGGLRRPRLAATLGVVAVAFLGWGLFRPGPLQVHFIDVGQGDATLVITPNGRTILVDTGGALGPQNGFDVGERVVVPYLRHYGVNSIDWLILTHNHQDHAGGAAAVAEIMGVHRVLLRQEGTDNPPAILRLQQAMQDKGMQEAERVGELHVDGVKVKLYQVGEDITTGAMKGKGGRSSSENGRSTVARVEYGQHSFLLTGDLEGESENKLSKTDLAPSTVLKVGHHGARKSTQSEFLARVLPQYAVVSVGADNQFGHPTPETMHRLQEWPVSVFRTDRDGAVVFHSDGEKLTVERAVN